MPSTLNADFELAVPFEIPRLGLQSTASSFRISSISERVRTTQSMDREYSSYKNIASDIQSRTIFPWDRNTYSRNYGRRYSLAESHASSLVCKLPLPQNRSSNLHRYVNTIRQYPEVDSEIKSKTFHHISKFKAYKERKLQDYDNLRRMHAFQSQRADSLPRFTCKGGISTTEQFEELKPLNNQSIKYADEENVFNNKNDISSLVLEPGEQFFPTDVQVMTLPSGNKAVTYTKFSQKGYGDQNQANTEIEKIVQRTNCLQDTMHTLEYFVKRNRTLFPDDIIIYQKIVFYLLSEAELKMMGENPTAEIYGVRIREKLVAPTGSDVADILQKYYSRYREVDVEYQEQNKIVRELKNVQSDEDCLLSKEDCSPKASENRQLHYKRRNSSVDRNTYIDEANLKTNSKPQFISVLKSKSVVTGQDIRLTCTVSGIPHPRLSWFYGNKILSNNTDGKYTITNNFGMCSLTICSVKQEDAGVYSVKATNSVGEVSSRASLTVNESADQHSKNFDILEDNSTYLRRCQRKDLDEVAKISLWNKCHFVFNYDSTHKGCTPAFTQEPPTEINVQEGDELTIRCVVDGDPMPVVTWFKGARELTYSERHRVVAERFGSFIMQIKSTVQTDPGEYTVIASNMCGNTTCRVFVNVLPRPTVESDVEWKIPKLDQHDYELIQRTMQTKMSPIFTKKLPREKELVVGETLILDCLVQEAKTREYIVGVDILTNDGKWLH